MNLTYLAQDWDSLDNYWKDFFYNNCHNTILEIDRELTLISKNSIIYPPKSKIFYALSGLNPANIKVVIIGQDPYHGENQANGLAFAVNHGTTLPPSLKNIFKELILEFNPILTELNASLLENWKSQGVLLLNSTLTVIKDKANSLAKIGWQTVTDKIIQEISTSGKNCVFILWGNYARNKKSLIDSSKHLILEGVHPSPLSASRGFFGCNHFKLANEYFANQKQAPVNWLNNTL
ncbi:uracil-DNA glycosylase [Aquella oligotrophica]|uniref:Uracil-DNA glycosylase n=1 Tax=Aquella oligotrophica TaxID=2067065 RepID=A0A2I7N381_9NEIS|nr:uracil-DNA glycosylase [Aquella oligotrophica]AUR50903.1 uracil-DNA glycosylase [Aquella oligotrophica]